MSLWVRRLFSPLFASVRRYIRSHTREEFDRLEAALKAEMMAQFDLKLETQLVPLRRMMRQLYRNQRPNLSELLSASAPVQALSFETYLQKMAALEPNAYPAWYKLLSVNEAAYTGTPADSCSVDGHLVAAEFAIFALTYMVGRVLDIGCGPQAMPSYLSDYPVELIAGIDPLLPIEPHPFEFVRGFAEFLPWGDKTFGAVLVATSLDHVLSLDRALEEISRVLKDTGYLLLWVAFIQGAAPYDPKKPNIQPIDAYHLFHFDQGWFEDLMQQRFILVERLAANSQSYFYAFKPRS